MIDEARRVELLGIEREAQLTILSRLIQEALPHGMPLTRRLHLATALLDGGLEVHVEPVVPFPADGLCVCGNTRWKIHESGYLRVTSASFESPCSDELDVPFSPLLNAYGNGWSDMSETGDHQWVECFECGRRYQCPDEIDWQS